MPRASLPIRLIRASHPGPTVAVTGLTALYAWGSGEMGSGAAGVGTETGGGLGGARLVLLIAAVLTGQLSIGLSNDLVDATRDRQVGRQDKPLATGELSLPAARVSVVLALVVTLGTSLGLGLAAGATQVGLVVGGGWAYNLGLKRTRWSFLPYLVAFGSLPAVVTLSLDPPRLPPWWVIAASGLLGVGAHLVNVLPDLQDDAATGVRGLPHRLGLRRVRVAAPVVLAAATALLVVGPGGPTTVLTAVAVAMVLALVVVAARGPGRVPFAAAIGIALVDVVLLVIPR